MGGFGGGGSGGGGSGGGGSGGDGSGGLAPGALGLPNPAPVPAALPLSTSSPPGVLGLANPAPGAAVPSSDASIPSPPPGVLGLANPAPGAAAPSSDASIPSPPPSPPATGFDEPPEGAGCPVCQCPFDGEECCSITPCNHIFHASCLTRWAASPPASDTFPCPLCRRRLDSPLPPDLRPSSLEPEFELAEAALEDTAAAPLAALGSVVMTSNPLAASPMVAIASASHALALAHGASPLSPGASPFPPPPPRHGPETSETPRASQQPASVSRGPAPDPAPAPPSSSAAAASSAAPDQPASSAGLWRRRTERLNAGLQGEPFWIASSPLPLASNGRSSSQRSDDSRTSSSAPRGSARRRLRSTSPPSRSEPLPFLPPASLAHQPRPRLAWGSGIPRPPVAWGSALGGPAEGSSPPPHPPRGGRERW
jgi:hypothetical protein